MKTIERADIAVSRRHDVKPGQVFLSWLGQAGFLVESRAVRFLIDPYLSDSLAAKYRGSHFPHERMVAPPVFADALDDIDFCFSTHGHTDHLDPGTLPGIARKNSGCRFVVPRSCRRLAVERGVPSERLITLQAEEAKMLGPMEVEAIPSAHEERRWDEEGNDLFLGYVMRIEGWTLYHSGDCVPYPGLVERLRRASAELFLLPVNGRDEERRRNGVPGNFTLPEAVAITRNAGGSFLIGHHFGMFDFNTIDPVSARRWIAVNCPKESLSCLIAELGREYLLD